MATRLSSRQRSASLSNIGQLQGKKLLFIGHIDYKKNVWALASQLGLQCYVVGPHPKEPVHNQVARYFPYDFNDHTKDETHSDVIAEFVTSEIGDVDGCLTMYDDCVPLTALLCTRLQKIGVPYSSAMATQQKSLTFEILKTCHFFSTGNVENSFRHDMDETGKRPDEEISNILIKSKMNEIVKNGKGKNSNATKPGDNGIGYPLEGSLSVKNGAGNTTYGNTPIENWVRHNINGNTATKNGTGHTVNGNKLDETGRDHRRQDYKTVKNGLGLTTDVCEDGAGYTLSGNKPIANGVGQTLQDDVPAENGLGHTTDGHDPVKNGMGYVSHGNKSVENGVKHVVLNKTAVRSELASTIQDTLLAEHGVSHTPNGSEREEIGVICRTDADQTENTSENELQQGKPLHNSLRGLSTTSTDLAKYTSRCASAASIEDLKEVSKMVGFPAIMKMDYGGGGRGIRLVHNLQESEEHFRHLLQLCVTSVEGFYRLTMGNGFKTHCVLMEFLQGSEHCVDLVAFHGELLLAVVTDKGPQCLPDTFHTVTIMPSLLTPDKQNDVIKAAWDCCQALGLRHGVFDVDIMLTSTGPKLIEINARLGGYCQREFARHCYDLDFFVLACMVAADVKPHFTGFASDLDIEETSSEYNSITHLPVTAASANASSRGQIIDKVSEGCNVTGTIINTSVASGAKTTASASKTKAVVTPERLQKQLCRPSFQLPATNCFMVGFTLYPHKYGAALKTTAKPDTLQDLHDEGELLFMRLEPDVVEEADEPPFGILAVKGRSFPEAREKLERLCLRLGIDAPELRTENYCS